MFAIPTLQAAQDYLAHPILGKRLRECTSKIFIHADREPTTIFGDIDALKFRSSMTLFDVAAPEDETLFDVALAILFRRWNGITKRCEFSTLRNYP